MSLVLTEETVAAWLVERGLASSDQAAAAQIAPLTGGVSAAVFAVRGPTISLVVKQALAELRVSDVWRARIERTDTEVAALRLCEELTPGAVPRVLEHDRENHIAAIELLPDTSRNWQTEIAQGRVHADAAAWAGRTLGRWHRLTTGDETIAAAFADFESFVEQRLDPFHATVERRLPELAPLVAPFRLELTEHRVCFVDGDFAMKNIHVDPAGAAGPWAFDFEVAHYGNPLFDLGFFLSFVTLSAIRWPALESELGRLRAGFLDAYRTEAPYADDPVAVAGHTACLILARTDGTSPAAFLDEASREQARKTAIATLTG